MFLKNEEIEKIGFKSIGKNVLISDKAVFYRPERITIGNNVRIDDFCVLANNIILHDYIHIAMGSYLLSGPNSLIEMEDFSGLAYQAMLLTNVDDYYGDFMTNPTVPDKYRKVTEKSIKLNKHCLVGAGSKIMPGVEIGEGTSIGAMSLVLKSTKPWKLYFGVPAKAITDRQKGLLELEKEFLNEVNNER